jgi:hypothetical protein
MPQIERMDEPGTKAHLYKPIFKEMMIFVCHRTMPGLCLLLLSIHFCIAQKPYFQQEVNYKITVALDDKTNTLTGRTDFEYINRSPDTLREIRVHLWANAYKNTETAFTRQELDGGSAAFYFAPEEDRGYYKKLDFTADGQKVKWRYDKQNPDIAFLPLNQPLLPGARVQIATPFLLKIPASFSRLGHVGTSYQITQWFPKPAVYDNRGWHAMPYLNQGEFYSEFGTFDVTITLPRNYVVGATGLLETASERAFLQQKEVETRQKLAKVAENQKDPPFPPSDSVMKTIRYTAEKVHDFAWFADKRFNVIKDTARLASGKTVDCWAMFTDEDLKLWKKGASYVRRAVEYYSRMLGEYPYPHATAVHSALSAGAGMEYPMITVISNGGTAKALDDVIVHEVGHNWFYGILGSNERDHPFMDEGLNSYYEQRYMLEYYGGGDVTDGSGLPTWLFQPGHQGSVIENGYLMLARENKDIPPDTHSDKFTHTAYGLEVYMKTAICMRWLERSVGAAKIDATMQAYYQKWKFKHPDPEDLWATFKATGLEADWFKQAMETRQKADFVLKRVEKSADGYRLTVQNKEDLKAPFPVTALKDGLPVKTKWFAPVDGPAQTVDFPVTEADAFVIDHDHTTLDLHRNNNYRRTTGLFPALKPVDFRLISPVQDPTQTRISALPWLGWNNYDKAMAGIVFYNAPFPPRRFQYYLAPGYGFGSRRFTGLADLRYRWYPGGIFPRIIFGVSAKTADYDYNATFNYYSKYYRVVPQVRFDLPAASKTFEHYVAFRTLFIGRNTGNFEQGAYAGTSWTHNTIHELKYVAEQRRLPNPFKATVTLETQHFTDDFGRPAHYLKGSLEWRQEWYYLAKAKVTARFFAGGFLQNTQRNRGVDGTAFALNPQGFNDYRFDQLTLARSATDGFISRQVSQTDGGFKAAFGAPFSGTLGNSNDYIFALNLKADLPQRLPWGIPLKPWFDIGYFHDATPIGQNRPLSEQLWWSGGLMLEAFKGGLEIYFPLVNCKQLKDLYCERSGGSNPSALFCGGNYFKWISWSIRLGSLDPTEILERSIR